MLECVINVSEGRDRALIARLAAAGAPYVLDVHSDPDHHRSVLTMCGPAPAHDGPDARPLEAAVRAVAAATVELVDLRSHQGVHPRIGSLDVVPFVSLARDRSGRLVDGPPGPALEARNRLARWAASALDLPCFLYGPERSLPDLRRGAWTTLEPDHGPSRPHPSAGAAAVGARPALVAYNLWLPEGSDLETARAVAARIRGPGLRTLGLQTGPRVQVSCNLVDPWVVGPGAAFAAVAGALGELDPRHHGPLRAELVGLLPRGVLDSQPRPDRDHLGLDAADTIEARLEQAGLDGGSF